MERRAGLEDRIRAREHVCKGLHIREAAVGDRVKVREVDHWPDPRETRREPEYILRSPQLAHAPHDLGAEIDGAILRLQALPQVRQVVRDTFHCSLAGPAEQVAGMDDDEVRAAGDGYSGGVVEHPKGTL